MSDTIAPRVRAFVERPAVRPGHLPIGYGLLIGAALSLGLWAGALTVVLRLLD